MKFVLSILVISICCLMGCSDRMLPGDRYTVYIDDKFNESEKAKINIALDEWNSSTYSAVVFETHLLSEYNNNFSDHSIFIIYSVTETTQKLCTVEPGLYAIGCTRTLLKVDGGVVYLAMDQVNVESYTNPNVMENVVKHEVGHAMGILIHLPPGNIMAPSTDQYPAHLTCDDIASFYAVRNIERPCLISE